MREDVRGELSLSEFAQSVNLSVWRLCHIFKSDVGMPPIRYLRLLRMERARNLLESSFLSVKEIAFQVGLNDESHFVRDFKSTYGFSPALYRTHFKNNQTEAAHNSNGNKNNNGSNGTNPNKVQQELVRAAKNSLLPSIHLVVCMVSYLSWDGPANPKYGPRLHNSEIQFQPKQDPLMNDKNRQAWRLATGKLRA